jgi:hypothetical protein
MGTGFKAPWPDIIISPESRAVAHFAGSRSPPRPRVADGVLKVSQKAAVPKLQFAEGVKVLCPVELVVFLAEQAALVPPLEPSHDHVHAPEPETAVAEPVEQRLVLGAEARVELFAEPQTPFTPFTVVFCAEQEASLPPLEPVQVQDHGPEPLTEEAVPTEQRLAVGAEAAVPFALPQTAFIAVGTGVPPVIPG